MKVKDAIKLVFRNRFLWISTILLVLTAYFSLPFVSKLEYFVANWFFEHKTAIFKQVITQEEQANLQLAKDIGATAVVRDLIKKQDAVGIQSFLLNEKIKQPDKQFLITDADGVVLARSSNSKQRGDNVFLTKTWGSMVSQGKEVASIELGTTVPLVILGATPIFNEKHQLIGSVFVGHSLNDVNTENIKERYLPGMPQVIFYSNNGGSIGASYTYTSTEDQLKYFFGDGKSLPHDEALRLVESQGKYFFIKNINLPSLNGSSIGGMVLVFPIPFYLSTAVTALVFGAIAFITLFILCLVFKPRDLRRYRIFFLYVGLAVTLCIFVFSFITDRSYVIKIATHLKKPTLIYNSVLRLEPESGIWDHAFDQHVVVRLDSGGEQVNTMHIVINYDPTVAEIVSIDTHKSVCPPQLFLEKEIDNKKGEVIITCVIPNPGFSSTGGNFADLLIHPIRSGDFKLVFNKDTTVLANDGLGTDVLRQAVGGNYQLTASQEDQNPNGPPVPVVVFSSSHPNSERWYNNRTVQFDWLSQSSTTFFYSFNQTPTDTPYLDKERHTTQQDFVSLDALAEGINYFHVTPQRNGVFGPTTNYEVKIDTMPPADVSIRVSNNNPKKGEIVRFEFIGVDDISGIQPNFYINIDGSIWLPSLPELSVPFYQAGEHFVSVRVFDNAGNFSESTAEVYVRE